MSKPLRGLRVLNTRPLIQSAPLNEAISKLGGTPLSLPALEIIPTPTAWLELLHAAPPFNQAIFVSSNAVHFFFEGLSTTRATASGKNWTWPENLLVTAIGSATAQALQQHEIKTTQVPLIADSMHLLAMESFQQVATQSIALIKGEGGLPLIEQTLVARHAQLTVLEVYRREATRINADYVNSLWRDDAVDIILFTSQQAIHAIVSLFGPEAQQWLCSKTCLVISPRLADVAHALGLHNVRICHHDEIIQSLSQSLGKIS